MASVSRKKTANDYNQTLSMASQQKWHVSSYQEPAVNEYEDEDINLDRSVKKDMNVKIKLNQQINQIEHPSQEYVILGPQIPILLPQTQPEYIETSLDSQGSITAQNTRMMHRGIKKNGKFRDSRHFIRELSPKEHLKVLNENEIFEMSKKTSVSNAIAKQNKTQNPITPVINLKERLSQQRMQNLQQQSSSNSYHEQVHLPEKVHNSAAKYNELRRFLCDLSLPQQKKTKQGFGVPIQIQQPKIRVQNMSTLVQTKSVPKEKSVGRGQKRLDSVRIFPSALNRHGSVMTANTQELVSEPSYRQIVHQESTFGTDKHVTQLVTEQDDLNEDSIDDIVEPFLQVTTNQLSVKYKQTLPTPVKGLSGLKQANDRISTIKGRFKQQSDQYSPELEGLSSRNIVANNKPKVKIVVENITTPEKPKMANAGTSAIKFYDSEGTPEKLIKPSPKVQVQVQVNKHHIHVPKSDFPKSLKQTHQNSIIKDITPPQQLLNLTSLNQQTTSSGRPAKQIMKGRLVSSSMHKSTKDNFPPSDIIDTDGNVIANNYLSPILQKRMLDSAYSSSSSIERSQMQPQSQIMLTKQLFKQRRNRAMGGSTYQGSRNSEAILNGISRSSNKRMLQIRPNNTQSSLNQTQSSQMNIDIEENDYLGSTLRNTNIKFKHKKVSLNQKNVERKSMRFQQQQSQIVPVQQIWLQPTRAQSQMNMSYGGTERINQMITVTQLPHLTSTRFNKRSSEGEESQLDLETLTLDNKKKRRPSYF